MVGVRRKALMVRGRGFQVEAVTHGKYQKPVGM